MKICINTLGCKVNQYESAGIHKKFREHGFEVYDSLEIADIYIINTCAVTAEAERKSRNAITKCRELNANAKIFVIGCAVQKNSEQFIEQDNVVYVNGNANKKNVLELIESVKIDTIPNEFEDFNSTENSRTRAFVKVQDGCDNFCSYCIVPFLRGRSRSRSITSVVDEITALQNCNEVVLTGINLSDYKFGGLGKLAAEIDNAGKRFRFGSLEVNIITDEFLCTLKKLNNFCPQFHLSLQSGSTEVLKKMNRHYTASEYVCACHKIYSMFENANITTDVIVGFPGESDENFCETVTLAQRVGFGDMHIFPYSKRSGTQAEKFKDLPKNVKTERAKRLSVVREELKKQYIEKFIGKKLIMLTENYEHNYTVGHTENFIKVYLDGHVQNNALVQIEIVEHYKDGAVGRICDNTYCET